MVPVLFDIRQRSLRRDRAARIGPELFLYERAFDDCVERLELVQRRFGRALLIGCPDPTWPERLSPSAEQVDVLDPGELFAHRAGGKLVVEDAWEPEESSFDLIVAVGTLDTVNDLPLALRLLGHAIAPDGLFLAAFSGGDTLPQLRNAMRAADAILGAAAPHVHPRIEASAVAPMLSEMGFVHPVVDVDRVSVSYRSLDGLIADLRRMGATNVLSARPVFVGRSARAAAVHAFASAGDGQRTTETFEILHSAAWSAKQR